MVEPVVASRKITFYAEVLPNGTHATFKHEGDLWMAWPAKKLAAQLSVTDRLIGALNTIRRECLQWVNADPADALRVSRLLSILTVAQQVADQAAVDKVEVQVS